MNSNNRISASVMLMAASLAFSPSAWSLGLGEAKVESYLNQPLKARIDLISQASDDLASVTAGLASAADYELIGANIEGVPVPLRFTVEDLEGDAYIAATSSLPINEPVLRLIVEVNWSSGRLLREYTLFLDPPAVAEAAPAPRIDQRKAAAPAPAQPARPEPAPAAQPTSATDLAPVAAAEYGPVRNGETLWGIANDWSRGSGLTVNQVMIAIQRENPGAFLNDNINLLKRGAILRMPDPAEVERISAAAAYREVAAQTEQFSGRSARSVASPATPLLSEEAAVMEPEAEVASQEYADAAAADESAEAATAAGADELAPEAPATEGDLAATDESVAGEGQDVLELIPPSEESELDSGSGFEESEQPVEAGDDVQALRENLARTEEELINQQQQNSYLEERIRELESELESADEGVVADADLANMEDRLRDERQAAANQQDDSGPWYSRLSIWLVGVLVLVAGLAGWLLSRRGQSAQAGVDSEASLRGIKTEAEDLLRVLAEDTKSQPDAAAAAESRADTAAETAGKAGDDDAAAPDRKSRREDSEAEVLDEQSSDPEIQLDLARAYISMGDKEAARVILEEVVGNGSEEQQAEAKKMLELL
jgi:pilus assembly protein FimV